MSKKSDSNMGLDVAGNKGLHQHRVTIEPEEKVFALYWEDQNVHHKTLDYLLGDGLKPNTPTDREREVAATVIQWLGSPVGQGFLKSLGYEKKPY
jgi:hypothetical protein